MERLTKALEGNVGYVVEDTKVYHDENGYSGEAINKLAKFENIYEDLVAKQNEISKEMEKLRAEGKTSSVKFKQLFANKLANSNMIILFETYIP